MTNSTGAEKKAGHTPGKWYVGAQNDLLFVIDAPPSPAPYDGPIPRRYGPNVIAKVDMGLAGSQANARLIAAAPTMLEALKEILKANDEFVRQMPRDWEGDPLSDACNKACAVVGEAEG